MQGGIISQYKTSQGGGFGLGDLLGLVKAGVDIYSGNWPGIAQDAASALQKFQSWKARQNQGLPSQWG